MTRCRSPTMRATPQRCALPPSLCQTHLDLCGPHVTSTLCRRTRWRLGNFDSDTGAHAKVTAQLHKLIAIAPGNAQVRLCEGSTCGTTRRTCNSASRSNVEYFDSAPCHAHVLLCFLPLPRTVRCC